MRFLLVVAALVSFGVHAQVSSVDVVKSPVGVINEIVLKGNGLGTKSVPIFYDQVNVALEKGVPNDYFDNFLPNRLITKQDTLSNVQSPWTNSNGQIYVGEGIEHRRGRNTGKYYNGLTVDSNLQNPRIHHRSGTPQESKKVYISWWFKQKFETRNYFQHELSEIDSDFDPAEGDEFVVDVGMNWTGIDKVYGRVIAYYPDIKLLHANYYAQNNTNRIDGMRLVLNKNGKGAKLAIKKRSYGSNKYLRVWESDGTAGTFRSSWTNAEVYQADFRRVQRSNVVPRQWNHMEYFADQTTGYIKTKVNGVVDAEGYYTQPSDVAGHSPTIGLIGQDVNQSEMHQEFWMDDIYLDGSFRRVVLGNAPKHSDVTHEEVQYHRLWTDTEIRFTPYYGSLDRQQPAYIYIYSENDIPNEEGIAFESPPKMAE